MRRERWERWERRERRVGGAPMRVSEKSSSNEKAGEATQGKQAEQQLMRAEPKLR